MVGPAVGIREIGRIFGGSHIEIHVTSKAGGKYDTSNRFWINLSRWLQQMKYITIYSNPQEDRMNN
jgi:hypothetical protein